MKIKQTVILVVAFVMPIGIFIFLKTLGKNEFEVQPLHQEGVMQVPTECGVAYTTPYTVPMNVLADVHWSDQDSLTLYIFEGLSFDERVVTEKLAKSNTRSELHLLKITSDSLQTMTSQDLDILNKDVVSIEQLQECFFVLEKGKNAVLLDKQQRIRGYYDLSSREEMDRLAVEVKIILKKY